VKLFDMIFSINGKVVFDLYNFD